MQKATLSLMFAIISVSFAGIFIRLSNENPLAIATWRMFLTVLILLPFFILQREEIKNLKKEDLTTIILIGIILSIHFAFFTFGVKNTSIASAVILVSSHPIFVGIVAHYFLKEKLSFLNIIGILLGFFGVAILSFGDFGNSTLYGNVLSLFAGICAGFYIIGGRKIRQKVTLITYVFIAYLVCALFLLLFSVSLSVKLYPIEKNELSIFILLAIIPTIFGHTMYNYSLRYVKARVVSISLLGEPLCATILAFAFLNEIPSYFIFIGGAIILAGIYLTVSKKFEKY